MHQRSKDIIAILFGHYHENEIYMICFTPTGLYGDFSKFTKDFPIRVMVNHGDFHKLQCYKGEKQRAFCRDLLIVQLVILEQRR